METLTETLQADVATLEDQLRELEAAIELVRSQTATERTRVDDITAEVSGVRAAHEDCVAQTTEMQIEIDGFPTPELVEELAGKAAEGQRALDVAEARVAALEQEIHAATERNDREKASMNAMLDTITADCDAIAAFCVEEDVDHVDQREAATATLQIYGKLLDNITSQREASYRDMVQDLIVGLERSSELDRAIEQLHDKFREKRERAIDEAHEFSGKLVTAFDTERNKLVQLYRMQCGRNTELRHHLHRGTHNSRPTQLTDKERKTLTQQKDLSEAVNKLRAELDSVTQELHELDRRVEATMQKSEVSDDAFVRGRDQKHADGRECQGLMVALQREQEQWRNAKNDLELLLRYVKVGGIPDSAAQPRWRLAVMAARRASSMKTSCATSMVGADDGAHARHHEVLSGTQTPQQQPEPSAAHDAAPCPRRRCGCNRRGRETPRAAHQPCGKLRVADAATEPTARYGRRQRDERRQRQHAAASANASRRWRGHRAACE
jgi:chromosome segregation ATPase